MTITKIEELYVVTSPKGRHFEMKERPCFGLSFCIDGQITYTHQGKTYLSDPEHAVLLPKGQSYTLYGDKKGRFPVIDFQCNDYEGDSFMVLPLQNRDFFLKSFEQMHALFSHPEQRPKMMSLFYEMLSRLTMPAPYQNPRLHTALQYLESHLMLPTLQNTAIAQAAGISEVYLRKLFLQFYGQTPKQYILERRMAKAKTLLNNSERTVTNIAEECGFSSVYHFCRSFKEKTGLTPTEYTKQTQNYGI